MAAFVYGYYAHKDPSINPMGLMRRGRESVFGRKLVSFTRFVAQEGRHWAKEFEMFQTFTDVLDSGSQFDPSEMVNFHQQMLNLDPKQAEQIQTAFKDRNEVVPLLKFSIKEIYRVRMGDGNAFERLLRTTKMYEDWAELMWKMGNYRWYAFLMDDALLMRAVGVIYVYVKELAGNILANPRRPTSLDKAVHAIRQAVCLKMLGFELLAEHAWGKEGAAFGSHVNMGGRTRTNKFHRTASGNNPWLKLHQGTDMLNESANAKMASDKRLILIGYLLDTNGTDKLKGIERTFETMIKAQIYWYVSEYYFSITQQTVWFSKYLDTNLIIAHANARYTEYQRKALEFEEMARRDMWGNKFYQYAKVALPAPYDPLEDEPGQFSADPLHGNTEGAAPPVVDDDLVQPQRADTLMPQSSAPMAAPPMRRAQSAGPAFESQFGVPGSQMQQSQMGVANPQLQRSQMITDGPLTMNSMPQSMTPGPQQAPSTMRLPPQYSLNDGAPDPFGVLMSSQPAAPVSTMPAAGQRHQGFYTRVPSLLKDYLRRPTQGAHQQHTQAHRRQLWGAAGFPATFRSAY